MAFDHPHTPAPFAARSVLLATAVIGCVILLALSFEIPAASDGLRLLAILWGVGWGFFRFGLDLVAK